MCFSFSVLQHPYARPLPTHFFSSSALNVFYLSPHFATVCFYYADESEKLTAPGEDWRSSQSCVLVAWFFSSNVLARLLSFQSHVPLFVLTSLSRLLHCFLTQLIPSLSTFSILLPFQLSLSLCHTVTSHELLDNPTNWNTSTNWTWLFLTDSLLLIKLFLLPFLFCQNVRM